MNERIFELAKQADLIQWDSLPSGARTPDHKSVVKARKFAELIVQECILTIQMGITRDGHNTEKYLRSMKHLKDIKEHFGVEE